MTTSRFLQNIIHRGQNLYDHDHFEEQAHLLFENAGPGWVDCLFHPWPRTQKETTTHAGAQLVIIPDADSDSSSDKLLDKIPQIVKVTALLDLQEAIHAFNARYNIFFIRQRNSRARLSISRSLFDDLRRQCSIFEKIQEYVLCFGLKSSDIQISPPASQFHFLPRSDSSTVPVHGTAFECAYVIRFVEPNRRRDGIPWSLRQAGIYHRFDGQHKPSTWMFLALSSLLEEQLRQYLKATVEELEVNPFEVHFLLFDSALAGWKGCISYLSAEVQKQSDLVFMVQFEPEDFDVTRLEERQYTKKIEDYIIDVGTALSFMLESLDALIVFYQTSKQRQQPEGSAQGLESKLEAQSDVILVGLQQRRRSLIISHAQAEALQRKAQSVSELISNILDLSNGNALKLLAVETRMENANMAVLTKRSVQDAATVKVLTVITLVYLPLTVVTNFFSTSFVNTATDTTGGLSVTVTRDVWILFAVGVPLTILTIYIWWIFAQKEVKGKYPGFWDNLATRVKSLLSRSATSSRRIKHESDEHE